jgi:hypothetical protein
VLRVWLCLGAHRRIAHSSNGSTKTKTKSSQLHISHCALSRGTRGPGPFALPLPSQLSDVSVPAVCRSEVHLHNMHPRPKPHEISTRCCCCRHWYQAPKAEAAPGAYRRACRSADCVGSRPGPGAEAGCGALQHGDGGTQPTACVLHGRCARAR